MKTTRSSSMPPAPRSAPSSPTTPTQSLQRSPSAPDLGATAKTPTTPKSPGDNSSFNAQPKASGSHVPQNTAQTTRPQSPPPSPTSGGQPKTVSSSLDAEMARNKAQLGGAQSRNVPLQPEAEGMAARVRKETAGNDKFEVKYSNAELNAIQSHGQQLGLPQKTIDNMVKVGSRNDTGPGVADQKRIGAEDLKAQMTEYKNVEKRGFPHLFHDKAQFDQFSSQLREGVAKKGIPSDNIVVQGSSVRTSFAGDVDVACLVNKQQYGALMQQNFGKKSITHNGVKQDLSTMNYDQMKRLADDLKSNPASGNSNARTFAHAMNSGIIKPSSKDIGEIRDPLNEKFREPRSPKDSNPDKVHNIAIVLEGSPFDTTPRLPLSK